MPVTETAQQSMQAPMVGAMVRPWMSYGPKLKSADLIEDVTTFLWESGSKTTADIKREIVEYLDQFESLVMVIDHKRNEKPDDPHWWPSMRMVTCWIDEDPFFAKAIDQWKHARQQVLLERVIYDLTGPESEKVKSQPEMDMIKQRLKFAASVLPRIVNKGMRERVEVDNNTNHLHLHANLSEEALKDRLDQLRRNPRVQAFLTESMEAEVIESLPVPPPPAEVIATSDLPFKDPDKFSVELGGG
jgi:hypothetical protein